MSAFLSIPLPSPELLFLGIRGLYLEVCCNPDGQHNECCSYWQIEQQASAGYCSQTAYQQHIIEAVQVLEIQHFMHSSKREVSRKI